MTDKTIRAHLRDAAQIRLDAAELAFVIYATSVVCAPDGTEGTLLEVSRCRGAHARCHPAAANSVTIGASELLRLLSASVEERGQIASLLTALNAANQGHTAVWEATRQEEKP